MSVFSLGGSLGWAAGPLLAVGLVDRSAWRASGSPCFPGILVSLVLLRVLPAGDGHEWPDGRRQPAAILRLLAGPLGLLMGISVVGAFAQRVFLTMEPIIVARAGGSEAVGAVALSVYLGAQALGTLAGGNPLRPNGSHPSAGGPDPPRMSRPTSWPYSSVQGAGSLSSWPEEPGFSGWP